MPLQQLVSYLNGEEVATEGLLDVAFQPLVFSWSQICANTSLPILNLAGISSVGGGFCGVRMRSMRPLVLRPNKISAGVFPVDL